MNIAQIEKQLKQLVSSITPTTFIYDLLRAYNLPKASITRLQKGNLNLSVVEGEISWKKKLFFKEVFDGNLHSQITQIHKDIKHDQRFIIVTDYKILLAIDTKTGETLDINITDLPKHYDFFLPWAGMEKFQHQNENPADVKAAEKMAKLFDEIKKDNVCEEPEFIHGLNVFLSRLLFCFFAEDTNIFKDNQFTNAISSHTQVDGSDLHEYLNKLFDVLNTEKNKRDNIPEYLKDFPYVNGGLFGQTIQSPKFTRKSRQAILNSGEMNWAEINPDIFGSMIQAVITPEHRGGLGMHYTSVPNIMKVIEPLFLNDLNEQFEKGQGNKNKLDNLLQRIYNLKIFDPACGSGNFLIIAYKNLCLLEIKLFQAIEKASGNQVVTPFSGIKLSQFYGIELDDFAHEIAILSLWLAEHQMNNEFLKIFGQANPTLPLKQAGKIIQGNACRLDWEDVCPKEEDDEIYILGNPPYLGSKVQNESQKNDMKLIFSSKNNFKFLDYISCWFYKSALYLNENIKAAFVTTNSICQGLQVEMLWPHLIEENIEIFFAYQPFLWSNNAKSKAGVTCSIVGIHKKTRKTKKYLYCEGIKKHVNNINAYLVDGTDIIVTKSLKPINNLPIMQNGNPPREGGILILSKNEKNNLLTSYPESLPFIRKLSGSSEFIRNIERWCIWIDDSTLKDAIKIPPIKERIERVREFRKNGGIIARQCSHSPHKFYMNNMPEKSQIIIPTVSSERRRYIPSGFINGNTVVVNSANTIFDPEPYVLGVISSYMQMIWVRTVAGRLKNDFRFAPAMCYNTFPFPKISKQKKDEITQCVFRIIDERQKHPEKTMAQLYDPDKMPDGLREAHRLNDLAIERCYRSKPFESDEERLEYLFKLYEKMIAAEQAEQDIFAKQKTTRKRTTKNK